MATKTRDEAAILLIERIGDRLSEAHDGPNDETIGRLGAILFGLDDDDVKTLRGTSPHTIDVSEIPYLIEMGLKSVNDPRILSVTADGGHDSEVMIDVVGGTTYIIRDRNIDSEDTDTSDGPADEDTPGSSTLIREILTNVGDHVARSLKMVFLASQDAPVPASLEGSMVLVSEDEGGIFAYGLDVHVVNAILDKLNEKHPSGDEDNPSFYSLDFDRMAHGSDYVKSVRKGDLLRLMNGEQPIGYVLHGTKGGEKLTGIVLD